MKLPVKLNFGVIKNRKVKIGYIENGIFNGYNGILKKVNQKGEELSFVFDNGFQLNVENKTFLFSGIRKQDDIIEIIYDKDNLVFSGFVAFTIFDTYGFPVEMFNEILKEMQDIHHELDMNGFDILKNLRKEVSHNTQFSEAF